MIDPLFSVDSDYDLMQDEFYGDLYVVRYEGVVSNENPETLIEEDNIFDAINNTKSVLREDENGLTPHPNHLLKERGNS